MLRHPQRKRAGITGRAFDYREVPCRESQLTSFFFSNLMTPHRNGVLQFAWKYCLRSIVLNNCTVRIPDQPKKVRFDLTTLFRALLCFDEVCCQQCEDKLPWRSELAAQCHVLVPTQEKLTSFLAARENLGSLIVLVLRSFELFWCILSGYECPTTTTKSNNPPLIFFSRCVSRKCCRNLFRGKKYRRNDDNLFVGFVSTAPRCWWTELQH